MSRPGMPRHRLNLYGAIASLVLLASCLQAWLVLRAVVPAADSVRYVSAAMSIEGASAGPLLATSADGPFAVVVHATHIVRRTVWDAEANWAGSVQLAAAWPLILLPLPLLLTFRRVLPLPAAWLASALLVCFPGVAHLGADGLPDGLHLLLCVTALWLVSPYVFQSPTLPTVREVTSPRQMTSRWLLAGVCLGLAVLLRAQGVFLAATLLLAVIGTVGSYAQRAQRTLTSAGWLAAGMASICLLLACWAGGLAPLERLSNMVAQVERPPSGEQLHDRADSDTELILASGQDASFAAKDRVHSTRFSGIPAAADRLLSELPAVTGWPAVGLVLVGLISGVWRRSQRVLLLLAGLTLLGAIIYSSRAGYLSARHLILAAPLLAYWCAAGLRHLMEHLPAKLPARSRRQFYVRSLILTCGLLLVTSVHWTPLHKSRAAHRQAGDWLRWQVTEPARVLDSRGWTMLYSGLDTYRYTEAATAFADPRLRYVVVEQGELYRDSKRSATLRELLSQCGEPLSHFDAPDGAPPRQVIVYSWDAGRWSQALQSPVRLAQGQPAITDTLHSSRENYHAR